MSARAGDNTVARCIRRNRGHCVAGRIIDGAGTSNQRNSQRIANRAAILYGHVDRERCRINSRDLLDPVRVTDVRRTCRLIRLFDASAARDTGGVQITDAARHIAGTTRTASANATIAPGVTDVAAAAAAADCTMPPRIAVVAVATDCTVASSCAAGSRPTVATATAATGDRRAKTE